LIALRNCQLVPINPIKGRQAFGGSGDKSYLEFEIVNQAAESLFVGSQPLLGLVTVRGKVQQLLSCQARVVVTLV
jgi:hypothetical protein